MFPDVTGHPISCNVQEKLVFAMSFQIYVHELLWERCARDNIVHLTSALQGFLVMCYL